MNNEHNILIENLCDKLSGIGHDACSQYSAIEETLNKWHIFDAKIIEECYEIMSIRS